MFLNGKSIFTYDILNIVQQHKVLNKRYPTKSYNNRIDTQLRICRGKVLYLVMTTTIKT